MIWINGRKLPDPDSLRFVLRPPAEKGARGKLSVTAKWSALPPGDTALALSAGAAHAQAAVTDPCTQTERTFEAVPVVALCEKTQAGYGGIEVTFAEE